MSTRYVKKVVFYHAKPGSEGITQVRHWLSGFNDYLDSVGSVAKDSFSFTKSDDPEPIDNVQSDVSDKDQLEIVSHFYDYVEDHSDETPGDLVVAAVIVPDNQTEVRIKSGAVVFAWGDDVASEAFDEFSENVDDAVLELEDEDRMDAESAATTAVASTGAGDSTDDSADDEVDSDSIDDVSEDASFAENDDVVDEVEDNDEDAVDEIADDVDADEASDADDVVNEPIDDTPEARVIDALIPDDLHDDLDVKLNISIPEDEVDNIDDEAYAELISLKNQHETLLRYSLADAVDDAAHLSEEDIRAEKRRLAIDFKTNPSRQFDTLVVANQRESELLSGIEQKAVEAQNEYQRKEDEWVERQIESLRRTYREENPDRTQDVVAELVASLSDEINTRRAASDAAYGPALREVSRRLRVSESPASRSLATAIKFESVSTEAQKQLDDATEIVIARAVARAQERQRLAEEREAERREREEERQRYLDALEAARLASIESGRHAKPDGDDEELSYSDSEPKHAAEDEAALSTLADDGGPADPLSDGDDTPDADDAVDDDDSDEEPEVSDEADASEEVLSSVAWGRDGHVVSESEALNGADSAIEEELEDADDDDAGADESDGADDADDARSGFFTSGIAASDDESVEFDRDTGEIVHEGSDAEDDGAEANHEETNGDDVTNADDHDKDPYAVLDDAGEDAPAEDGSLKKSDKIKLAVAGGALVVAVGVVGGFVWPGFFTSKSDDAPTNAPQASVTQEAREDSDASGLYRLGDEVRVTSGGQIVTLRITEFGPNGGAKGEDGTGDVFEITQNQLDRYAERNPDKFEDRDGGSKKTDPSGAAETESANE